MKIGRNDPCYCGSGKKHKRCCMGSEPAHTNPVAKELEAILAMNPNLDIDDINTVLKHKVKDSNNRPHPDFCGLSPAQMSGWLYEPFDTLQSLTFNTPKNLSVSPVMRYLGLILDKALEGDGEFKATAKGNFPAALVKQASALLPEFAIFKYDKGGSTSEFTGINEDKMNALHYTRILADLAGIIVLRGGRFHVKKSTLKQYQTLGIHAFFHPMLKAATQNYNWGYLDGFKFDANLHTFWLFMLWRIQTHKSIDRLVDDIALAFPQIMHELPRDEDAPPEMMMVILLESRFIKRFLTFWGFAIIDPVCFVNGKPIARRVEIQPLLSETFQFNINR